jgi:hypothetical protein
MEQASPNVLCEVVAAGTGDIRLGPATRTGRRDIVISHSAWFKNSVRSLGSWSDGERCEAR